MNSLILSLISLVILFSLAGSAFASGVVISNPLRPNDLPALLEAISSTVAKLVGVIATIMIVVAGIMYLVSGGNPQKMEAAKKTLIYAIVGLVIAVLAVSIIAAVKEILGLRAS
ncbi:MAG: TrbC/VirB2 family protein [Candidatus Staskawiczbacteria bacterium]|nr:TrbC/VirB2 family protein [Candidatus Staskawiczbacteria bacterium]